MAAPADRSQFVPLLRLFVGRFFENDLTASAGDLKRSFFGLLAILGVPGALVPFFMSFRWTIVGQFQGVQALRLLSRADKELYLGFSMAAAGAIAALTWDALRIDERDALILGQLPVRSRTIIAAKLAAMAVYIGGIGLTMHVLSAGAWGTFRATGRGNSFAFFVHGVVGHFVAGCAATAFVILVVMALQGTVVATLGPRVFARLSGVFQSLLVVVTGLAVFLLPQASQSITYAYLRPADPAMHSVLIRPSFWFFGMYEWFLGDAGPIIDGLARTAAWSLAGVFVVAIVSNVLAYRRVMRTAIGTGVRHRARLALPFRLLARLASTRPDLRASAEFFLTSITRVERQRLAIAVGTGVAIAWTVPGLQDWPALLAEPTPSIPLLTLPFTVTVLVLVAARVAASLPADLKSAWIFDVTPQDPVAVRNVVERLFFVGGILPCALISSAIAWWRWGGGVALAHGIFTVALGTLVVELLVRGLGYVPGTQPWRPEHARLRARWPIYLLGFIWLATGLPSSARPNSQVEVAVIHSVAARFVITGIMLAAAFELRRRATLKLREPAEDPEALEGAPAVLHLS